MIRIDRGEEPVGLAEVRRRELAKAILHWASAPTATFERYRFDGYREEARTLFDRQHEKCAFCERIPGWHNQPVEHFRPKNGAERGDDATSDPHHYWWLAWTWENLFFACGRCNGKATKGNRFPLRAGSKALRLPDRSGTATIDPACFDLASEQPLLLDPSRDDPMRSIVWRPSNEGAAWSALVWRPYDVDDRGKATIGILALDDIHAGHVSREINRHLTPKIERIERLHAQGDRVGVAETWAEVLMLFAPEAAFLAATYDACEWFLSQPAFSAIAPMLLPKAPYPTRPARASAPSGDAFDPPALAARSDRLRLQVRAGVFNVREGVLALCAEADFDDASLATILDCQEDTVRDHRVMLMREGKLRELTPGRYGV